MTPNSLQASVRVIKTPYTYEYINALITIFPMKSIIYLKVYIDSDNMAETKKLKRYEEARKNALFAIKKARDIAQNLLYSQVNDDYRDNLITVLNSVVDWLDKESEDMFMVRYNLTLATEFVQKVNTDDIFEMKHCILQCYEYVAVMEGIIPKIRLITMEKYPRCTPVLTIPYKDLWY